VAQSAAAAAAATAAAAAQHTSNNLQCSATSRQAALAEYCTTVDCCISAALAKRLRFDDYRSFRVYNSESLTAFERLVQPALAGCHKSQCTAPYGADGVDAMA
jgi:hypothetical protein